MFNRTPCAVAYFCKQSCCDGGGDGQAYCQPKEMSFQKLVSHAEKWLHCMGVGNSDTLIAVIEQWGEMNFNAKGGIIQKMAAPHGVRFQTWLGENWETFEPREETTV